MQVHPSVSASVYLSDCLCICFSCLMFMALMQFAYWHLFQIFALMFCFFFFRLWLTVLQHLLNWTANLRTGWMVLTATRPYPWSLPTWQRRDPLQILLWRRPRVSPVDFTPETFLTYQKVTLLENRWECFGHLHTSPNLN